VLSGAAFFYAKKLKNEEKNMEIINENKLYQVINRFFTDPKNLLGELIQNACRAKADKIDIIMGKEKESGIPGENTLYIQDNGTGIHDLKALLGIAYSDWDDSVETQEPAGMGFLQLIASACSVKVESVFGSLLIDCDRFLHNAEYRRQLINQKQKSNLTRKGTTILAELKNPANQYMYFDQSLYSGFDAKVIINGIRVEPFTLSTVLDQVKAKELPYKLCTFQNNQLLISFSGKYNYPYSSKRINWYGQFIPYQFTLKQGNSINIYYDVKNGTPLTPVYPDRVSLAKDSKLKEFEAFLNREMTDLIKEYILNQKLEDLNGKEAMVSILHTFYNLCTEEEARQMPWIPVMKNAFDYSDYSDEVLMLKSDLNGFYFCTDALHADSGYRIAGEFPLSVLRVNASYSPILKALGLKEITDLNIINNDYDTIILQALKLKVSFHTNEEMKCEIKTALICDYSNDFHVYGTDSADIYRMFLQNYYEIIGDTDSFDSIETQQEYALRDFLSEYEKAFSVINFRNFSFLPNFSQVKSICFEGKSIQIHYHDNTSKQYLLEAL